MNNCLDNYFCCQVAKKYNYMIYSSADYLRNDFMDHGTLAILVEKNLEEDALTL